MRRSSRRFAALTVVALALICSACASRSAGGSGPGRNAPIPTEELDKWSNQDLYSVILKLRPTWLQSRATYTGIGRQEITVVLDGMVQQDGHDLLRNLRAGDVREVRYMNAADATTLYGTGTSAGAILVFSRTR